MWLGTPSLHSLSSVFSQPTEVEVQLAAVLRSLAPTICLTLVAAATVPAAPGYQHYLIGDPRDVVTSTSGLIVLQGGGDDVDQNYVRMAKLGGGGDFVVLRASGADEYNAYIYELCDCDSVETLILADREAASDPFVVETIRNAEAVFIAGGDQSRYVRFWQGTPVAAAIEHVAAKPAPVGGTSAGMAILGEFVYSAMSDASLTSETALADPFHRDVTLVRGFLSLPALGNILTDQHLEERDRIGRTLALLARLVHDGWTSQARAIAADRETSLHLDPATGTAQVLATADHVTPYVWFLRTASHPDHCAPGAPLTFRDVEVYRIDPEGTFDIDAWEGDGGIAYFLSAEDGELRSSRGEIY
jgi:cyanophycinase-like exopeptidase